MYKLTVRIKLSPIHPTENNSISFVPSANGYRTYPEISLFTNTKKPEQQIPVALNIKCIAFETSKTSFKSSTML